MAGFPAAVRLALFAPLTALVLTQMTFGQDYVRAARAATAATAEGSSERLQALLAEARILLRYNLEEASAIADRASQLAATLGDDGSRACALAVDGLVAAGRVGPDAARTRVDAAVRLLHDDVPLSRQGYVWLAKAIVHFTVDDIAECLTALHQAIDAAERAGDTDTLVKASLVAAGAIGWDGEPAKATDDLLAQALAGCSPPLIFEARVAHAITHRGGGAIDSFESELRSLLAEAMRNGDRASAGFLQSTLGRIYAPEDLERARDFADEALTTFRLWGHREHIGRALHFLAQLAVHRQRPREALALIEQALASIDGLGMLDTTVTVLETAVQIASIAGEPDKARQYGERQEALTRILTERNTREQRGRFWRLTNELSRKLHAARTAHLREIAELDRRWTNALLFGGGALVTLLLTASMLLLRSHRRLANANAALEQALASAHALQEERAALQQNLQQIERLDSIGLLAGGFAHDFNNILVGVRGNAQLLQMDDNLTDEQQEMLSQILQASDRAAGLCRDILAYAHAAPTPTDVVDLRDVITGLVPLAQAGFGSGIEIALDSPDRPMPVEADRTQIEQVFLNLLVNAGDAIEDHGKIRVSIDECRLDCRPPSGNWFGEFPDEPRDCIAVSVLDNGHGMAPETVRRIFDPFFSTRFAGRGLGLAAVFGILRRHQGIVEVQSELGRGSQFTVYLPKAEAKTTSATVEPTVVIPQVAPKRHVPIDTTILVVDDEEPVRKVAQSALAAAGYRVLVAASGVAAIELLEEHRETITIALLDMTMPDMDGPDVARCLLRRQPDLRVVFMTGHGQPPARCEDLEVPLISKPFDLSALIEILDRTRTQTS